MPALPLRSPRPTWPTRPIRYSPYSPFVCTSVVLPSFRPSPDRVPSCGGPGLGAPVIPPSRAGFPLRPRPLEGLGVSSPPGRSATTCGAGSCSRVAGVIVPAPGALGRRGRVPSAGCPGLFSRARGFNPHGSRGWYGARGLTPPPYSVGCPWWATGDWRPGRTPAVGLGGGLCGLYLTAAGARGVALLISLGALLPAFPI